MKAHAALAAMAPILVWTLAACSSEAPEAPEPAETDAPSSEPMAQTPRTSEDRSEHTGEDRGEDTGTLIPATLQGRWGLVAADCEPGRADAKGLMVVDADSLEFYESMGMLGDIDQRAGDMIHADFAFTGEGMTWSREMELAVAGDTLTRTEYGDEAMPAPLEYTRCG